MLDWYNIPNTKTTNPGELASYKQRLTQKTYLEYYRILQIALQTTFKQRKAVSLLRVGDGELGFLSGKRFGNIASRHRTREGVPVQRADWLQAMRSSTILALNVEPLDRVSTEEYFTRGELDNAVPVPVVYALLASGDLLRMCTGLGLTVGLIGNTYKLQIVAELMKNSAYQEYLGIESFHEYIPIPQTGAANDPDLLLQSVLSNNKISCDVYLAGLGIGKIKFIPGFSRATGKSILDIGCGIDALAGCVCHERPYFANWINFRIRGYPYAHIDQLDYDSYNHSGYAFRYVPWHVTKTERLHGWIKSYKLLLTENFRWFRFIKRLNQIKALVRT